MQGIILAAGEGERLKSLTPYKPMLSLSGEYLLDYILRYFLECNLANIYIHFNDAEREMDTSKFKNLSNERVRYGFKSTQSSFHTFVHSIKEVSHFEGHILVSMVDTIMKKSDFQNYVQFCRDLKEDESALLITSYIEDEKPLTVKVDDHGYITSFGAPIEETKFITSGMYCFSSKIVPLLKKAEAENISKMRNFLSYLIKSGHAIKAFHVEKTMDIDRPEDINSAMNFLKEIG